MVGSSKILTVSYGTFSCTLEGFDDSFETMKAIAEYFRDLAADDRYFGAEPPTPDAEMLARIAEREIARRVEAHEHQGRIVLRAQEGVRATGTALAAAAPAAPEAEETGAQDLTDAAAALRPEGTEPEESDSAAQEPAQEPAETALESEMAEADAAASADAADAIGSYDASAAPITDEAPEAEAADMAPDPQEEAQPVDASPVADEPDGLAAKLNLIRSVVGEDAQYSEDEHAQGFSGDASADAAFWSEMVEETGAEDLTETAEEDVVAEDPTGTTEDGAAADDADMAQEDDLAWTYGMTDGTPQGDGPAEAETGFEYPGNDAAAVGMDAGPDSAGPDIDAPEADVTAGSARSDDEAVSHDEQEEPIISDAAEELPAAAETGERAFEDTLAALLADAARPADAAEAPAEDADEEEMAGPRPARVLRVRRADFEAARASGALEEAVTGAETDEDETANIFGEDDGALSPEEEAELQRELAELDLELGEPEEEDASESPVPLPAMSEAGSERGKLDEMAEESDLERIFGEADSQMAAPETSRRRNTIQHLRAALAATRAEKAAGAELSPKPDENPYRSDLAAVVRPRRPEAGAGAAGPRSVRPEEPRPAPLKLVAEQRVDTAREPVRPRRVTTPQPELLAAETGGFSEFAEDLGATDLPDLLEAAAAYLADVEGRAQFSRPMLMGKLREVDEEGFSREEGLRSFGKLLREGKLQKLSGGRFAVTEATEFRAEAKRRAS